ncbi:ADAM17 [Bugula neritina]|uniref:ADAM17 n=1 Tax=Bugula neritina TaxID=10212 RepID=A0A7J7JC91_BUGNE|nr:ADAM17 [Bugula neritina]
MQNYWMICKIVLTVTILNLVACDLSKKLRNYELLQHTDIVSESDGRAKRSLPPHLADKPEAIKQLTIKTPSKTFDLYLTENKELFGKEFSVKIIGKDGQEESLPFNTHNFLYGIVLGEANTEVFLHWDTNNALNAKIVTREDTYYIEPSYRLVSKAISDNYSMIVYKASDLIIDPKEHREMFGGVKPKPLSPHQQINYSHAIPPDNPFNVYLTEKEKERKRRQAVEVTKNTCGLLVVIDYRFLHMIMDDDAARASNYVVDLIGRVNKIYRGTTFGTHSGFGFQIEQILIDTDMSSCKSGCSQAISSNCLASNCTEKHMLSLFLWFDSHLSSDKTGNTDYKKFCLAHLFTAYAFDNGVLGLAYIASPSTRTFGGICSGSFYDSSISAQVYLNTGWSSAFNKRSEKILTQEAEIVLAHELGHNWGSEHDPDSKDCSPADVSGGKYIMYTYSVNGEHSNNKKFSACSKASIGQVLTNKADICFKEMSSPTRGNFKQDADEECDAGLQGDACCTNDQKLKLGADCSITNHVCCKNCRVADSQGQLCSSASELSCVANSVCTGTERACHIKFKDVGDYCQNEQGRCVLEKNETVCRSFARALGLNKCTCPNNDDVCKLCHDPGTGCRLFKAAEWIEHVEQCPDGTNVNLKVCSKSKGNPLKPYDVAKLETDASGYVILKDSICAGGYCDSQGICQRQSTDIVARIWEFFEDLTFNSVVAFMKSNIAGTVAVFSFILWLPCVIAVYCYDKKQEKTAKLEEDAFRSISVRESKSKSHRTAAKVSRR